MQTRDLLHGLAVVLEVTGWVNSRIPGKLKKQQSSKSVAQCEAM